MEPLSMVSMALVGPLTSSSSFLCVQHFFLGLALAKFSGCSLAIFSGYYHYLHNIIIYKNLNFFKSFMYQVSLTRRVPVWRSRWMTSWDISTCHMVWQMSWGNCFLHSRPACQELDAASVTYDTSGLTVLRLSKATTLNVLTPWIP